MSTQAKTSLDATDFYDVRGLLSEEEQQIQDATARYVDERVLPHIADAFDEHRFPTEWIKEIADLGLLGCNLEGYDCAGLNNVAYGSCARNSNAGTAACAVSSPCRAAFACGRSTPTEAKSRNSAGFRRWPAARSSVASA